MCNKMKCMFVNLDIDTKDLKEVSKQLDSCTSCCHKKEVGKLKDNTYAAVRKKYVQLFWQNIETNRHTLRRL